MPPTSLRVTVDFCSTKSANNRNNKMSLRTCTHTYTCTHTHTHAHTQTTYWLFRLLLWLVSFSFSWLPFPKIEIFIYAVFLIHMTCNYIRHKSEHAHTYISKLHTHINILVFVTYHIRTYIQRVAT